MYRLILFRHARALSPEGVDDHERPLDPAGVRAAPVMARWLEGQGLVPDLALVSPSVRTKETWALAVPIFGRPVRAQFEPSLYESQTSSILSLIRSVAADVKTLAVVGHNPGLEDLAGQLAGIATASARQRLAAGFPPGSLAVLECPIDRWDELRPGAAELTHAVAPADLKAG